MWVLRLLQTCGPSVRLPKPTSASPFALGMYREALHEQNQLFKIARLFGVLEALAYALKDKETPSRKAIRKMLGLEDGAVCEVRYAGRTVRYDRIELAGLLRNRVFHGVPFRREHLQAEWRDSFDILTDQPGTLASALMRDCELQFARWANNTSLARAAAEERRVASA